jgi:hypothetical protein
MIAPKKNSIALRITITYTRSVSCGSGRVRTVTKNAKRLNVPSIYDVTNPSEALPFGAERNLARIEPNIGEMKAVRKNHMYTLKLEKLCLSVMIAENR